MGAKGSCLDAQSFNQMICRYGRGGVRIKVDQRKIDFYRAVLLAHTFNTRPLFKIYPVPWIGMLPWPLVHPHLSECILLPGPGRNLKLPLNPFSKKRSPGGRDIHPVFT